MPSSKDRLEVYIPQLRNPDENNIRKPQDEEHFFKVRSELTEYFGVFGLTIDSNIGWYKGQVEPQRVIKIDVDSLTEEQGRWLQRKEREWAQLFDQEVIYILHFRIVVI